jgi:drug/metabolite transporter (DMT)-like permease
MVLLPIPIGIAMFVFAPSYSGVLIRSAVGFVVLLLAVVVMACGYALTEVAIRMWHRGKVGVGTLVAVASLVFCAFPALWLVLLGPAVVILIQKPQ